MLAVVSSQSLRFGTHVDNPKVIAAATETPRGERAHDVCAMLPRVMGVGFRNGWLGRKTSKPLELFRLVRHFVHHTVTYIPILAAPACVRPHGKRHYRCRIVVVVTKQAHQAALAIE
jgi:hypothetical protein